MITMLPKSPRAIEYRDDPYPRSQPTVFNNPRWDFLALITIVILVHGGLLALAVYLAV